MKIAIGNHHFVTRKRLENLIQRDPNLSLVGSYGDGSTLYNQIVRRQPGLVIMNPTMPGVDGIHLIEMVRKEPKLDCVKFLLIGSGGQKKLLEFLDDKSNVGFINYENSDETILKAIYQMMKRRGMKKETQLFSSFPDQGTSENLQLVITEMMHGLGIPAHVKGYVYLRNALMTAVEDMEVLNAVTKQLYPDIANTYNTTPGRVERAIRHAIEIAWNRSEQGAIRELFGYSCKTANDSQPEKRGKPTNSEFIALLADKIRLEVIG